LYWVFDWEHSIKLHAKAVIYIKGGQQFSIKRHASDRFYRNGTNAINITGIKTSAMNEFTARSGNR